MCGCHGIPRVCAVCIRSAFAVKNVLMTLYPPIRFHAGE
jgi:hypothetical protein